jgi:branched-chain amino acid transport system permease protein
MASPKVPLRPAQAHGVPRTPATGALIALTGAMAVLLPALGLPASYQAFLYLVFFWIALATSWAIFSGATGYFSFGTGAFVGIGAYTAANLVQDHAAALSVLAAGVMAATVAAAFGAVVFRVKRLKGEVFALVTLSLTFVVGSIVLNTPLDGGSGVFIAGSRIPEILGSASTTVYMAQAAVAALAVLTAWHMPRTKFGNALFAISDSEAVAELCGVPTYAYKVLALTLSSFVAGVAGGVHALFVGYLTVAETFSVTVPLYVLLMGVLGGARHWAGPAAGAAIIAVANTAFVGGDSALATHAAIGAALVVAVLFLPEGIMRRPERTRTVWHGPEGAVPNSFHSASIPALQTLPALQDDASRPAGRKGGTVLSCSGVTLSFKGVKALDGVDLDVREGEILGLVGPNGSGKSTLINAISGFHRPQAGAIAFAGQDLACCQGHRIARLGIGRTFQIPQPFSRMTLLDNVRLAAMFGARRHGEETATEEAWQCLELVKLSDRGLAYPPELNLHQRKFLELARALATGAEVLLLDEVLAGMTPAEIGGAIVLVRRIRDLGRTIIFVEHNIRAVLELTDRLAVLDQGKVLAIGIPEAVMGNPAVVAAYLGAGHA